MAAFTKATAYFYERSSTIQESDSAIYGLLCNEEYEAAYDEADDFLARCQLDGNAARIAAAMLTCVQAQLCCYDMDQATENVEKALELANDTGNAKLQAAATSMLAKVTMWSSPAEALVKAQEASSLAVATGDLYLRALVDYNMGSAFIASGAPTQAAAMGAEIIALFRDAGDSVAEGCALLCASEFAFAGDDLATALKYAKTAASKFESVGHVSNEALAFSIAARAALHSPNTSSEGVNLAEKAITLFKRSDNRKGAIALKLLLAEHMLQGNQYMTAEDLAEEALKICKEIGDAAQEADSLQVLATIRLALAVADSEESGEDIDTSSATEAARYALAAFRKLGSRQGEAKAMYKLAQIRYYAEAMDTAKMGAEEAQAIFRHVGDVSGEADSVLLIAYVQRASGHFDAAKRHANKAMSLYQSIGSSVGLDSCNEFLDKVKESQTEKHREDNMAKKAQGSTTKTGLVKLVNNAEEATHLLSYFAEMNDEEDTELTEFDLSAWGDTMLAVK